MRLKEYISALTEKFIKELHLTLKNGTSDSKKEWLAVGDYKKLPSEVDSMDTALPEEVAEKLEKIVWQTKRVCHIFIFRTNTI